MGQRKAPLVAGQAWVVVKTLRTARGGRWRLRNHLTLHLLPRLSLLTWAGSDQHHLVSSEEARPSQGDGKVVPKGWAPAGPCKPAAARWSGQGCPPNPRSLVPLGGPRKGLCCVKTVLAEGGGGEAASEAVMGSSIQT
ncbi:hypothetical protein P7K49_015089 [Saguinus oedipus]|uniref:Uncharacterized protein n=1 Tax=Saguinus oedipus TaxID=9490 RepID=A0ABQ9V8A1_SAGOE|nr:hypothetical protein P7K49_015089 [Saguinus oedipus]